jgi:hypothetical protein
MEKIRFVVATRETKDDFFSKTATGKSIPIRNIENVELKLFTSNQDGLAKIYNQAIEESINDPAILIFMHDDIHLLDYFWAECISNALTKFQVVGIAGNKRRVPRQPSWAFIDDKFSWDEKTNLSGVVGHGTSFPPTNLSVYGPSNQEVKLLDGLLLASHSKTLIDNDVRFDEKFDFHFYDLDFCRTIESKSLTMGTCQISVTHESGGSFGSESWKKGYEIYLEKWKD